MSRLYRVSLDAISAAMAVAGRLIATVAGGAKGVTTAAVCTSTPEGADHQALDVQLYHAGVAMDPARESGKLTDLATVTGALADAAVDGDAAGSLAAKLRGINKAIAALNALMAIKGLGTSVYCAVSGVSNNFAADFAAGDHLLYCTCDVCFRVNAAGDNTAAVWATSPAIILPSGFVLPIKLAAAARLTGITTGGAAGSFMGVPLV